LRVGIEYKTVVRGGIYDAAARPFLILIRCDEVVQARPAAFRSLPPLLPDLIMPVGTSQRVTIRFGLRDRASIMPKNGP
jgi:hypothetical protein